VKSNNNLLNVFFATIVLAIMCACGGDDKKNELPEITSNVAPTVEERKEVVFSVTAVDPDGAIESVSWSQLTGPTIVFTSNQEQLSFKSPEVEADSNISFEVVAMDNDGGTTTLIVESQIIDVNRAPIVEATTHNVEYNTSLEITLAASDPDSDPLSFEITSQPESGVLVAVNTDANLYKYTPTQGSITADTFTVEVGDGHLTTSAVINLALVDTSAPLVLSVLPLTDDLRVSLESTLMLEFDDVMLVESLLNGTTDCNGSIQLSMDDFVTCAQISTVNQQPQSKKFDITLSQVLLADSTYQLKVTADAINFYGTGMAEQIINSFKTESNDLKITEISASKYYSDNRWVEIYNGSAEDINLSDYALRSRSVNLDDFVIGDAQMFSLSDKVLATGEYILLQGRFGNGYWQSSVAQSEQIMLVGNTDDNIRPAWFSDSFVELVDKDATRTVDFVRWGSNAQQPLSAVAWIGDNNAVQLEEELGDSLIRDLELTDTNTANDWQFAYFITPGGNNDISCSEDTDADNIPDCAEQEGTTFAGLPLYEWGARLGVKDVFIEIDYMESEDPGVNPQRRSLDKVVESFAAHDIAIHFDAGDLFHSAEGISAADYDLGGGSKVDFYLQTTFVSSETAPSILDHKVNNFDLKRRPIFHYMLMANTQQEDGSAGSSGFAEILGNDLMITLGNWGFSLETVEASNTLINMQASTIMHEFGHNLGLRHGGDENTNNKPNHTSIMNYLYQLNGLPTIGNREGDRYYRNAFRDNLNCNLPNNELLNGFTSAPADFKMDYSSGTNATIDESNIDEAIGFGNANSTNVDFNCNAVTGETLNNFDINLNASDVDLLKDVDEWSIIDLQFTNSWSGNVSGNEYKNSQNRLKSNDIISNDQQSLIKEDAPSSELLESIRSLRDND
jgi:hypothetical protein